MGSMEGGGRRRRTTYNPSNDPDVVDLMTRPRTECVGGKVFSKVSGSVVTELCKELFDSGPLDSLFIHPIGDITVPY